MTPELIVELVGIVSSLLVLISYLFSNQVKLRMINLIASAVFVAYGVLLAWLSGWVSGWSVIALNSGCIVVHIVWLLKHFRKSSEKTANSDTAEQDTKEV